LILNGHQEAFEELKTHLSSPKTLS
jgi:hypothetical protein